MSLKSFNKEYIIVIECLHIYSEAMEEEDAKAMEGDKFFLLVRKMKDEAEGVLCTICNITIHHNDVKAHYEWELSYLDKANHPYASPPTAPAPASSSASPNPGPIPNTNTQLSSSSSPTAESTPRLKRGAAINARNSINNSSNPKKLKKSSSSTSLASNSPSPVEQAALLLNKVKANRLKRKNGTVLLELMFRIHGRNDLFIYIYTQYRRRSEKEAWILGRRS
jgi:hypothetical protein